MSAILSRSSLFVFVGLLAAGCNGNQEKLGTADELDVEMHRVCVGRYFLDVPAGLNRQQNGVDGGGDATFYFGHDENFTKADATVTDVRNKGAFESTVLAREADLRQQRNLSTGGSMFVSRESLLSDVELISFYARADLTDAIKLEVHALLGNAHVVLGQTAYSADARAGVQSELVSLLSSSRSSGSAEGSGRGFCVGSVVFDFGHDYEEAEVAYAGSLNGIPIRLQLDINTFEQAPDEPSLIERGETNLEGLGTRPRKLRAGSRTLAGDAGDEWLGSFADNGQRVHAFYAETRTKKPSRESPKVLVSLSTGGEEAPSPQAGMDDSLAMKLWDRVLVSLRKRSG